MSLNWNTENVKYFQENPDKLWVKVGTGAEQWDDVNIETKSIIFGTMLVDIGSLTIETMSDWYARYKTMEHLENYYLYQIVKDGQITNIQLTAEILLKHEGLYTNVANMPHSKWSHKYLKYLQEQEGRTDLSRSDITTLVKFYKLEFRLEQQKLYKVLYKVKEYA